LRLRNKSAEEETKMKTRLLFAAIAWTVLVAPIAWAQKGIEVTPFIGGQINGGVDLSTSLYKRIDVQNGLNYGLSASYAIASKYTAIEFIWSHSQVGTVAQPPNEGRALKLFNLTSNQFLGDFVIHFKDGESRLRPFVLIGAGANQLSPDRNQVSSITRFTWVFGGGVKYNLSKHVGVRLQAKWSPTYINTAVGGIWCDPFWSGCWAKGDAVFLNELDGTVGLTFRF
jgi:opacity protein-like surface antigen